jgi:rhodanese-related sulfurtransferase
VTGTIGGVRSVTVHELRSALDEGATVIDVREPEEFATGHVPGARLVPLMTVPQVLAELPADEPVYVICQIGARSAQAALFLLQHGVDACNVDGGTSDWVAAGYPVNR